MLFSFNVNSCSTPTPATVGMYRPRFVLVRVSAL